jgi:hypothetical protein
MWSFRVVFTQYAPLLTEITNSSHTHSTDKKNQDGPVYVINLQKSEILQIRTHSQWSAANIHSYQR